MMFETSKHLVTFLSLIFIFALQLVSSPIKDASVRVQVKGTFLTHDRLVLFPLKCEMAIFLPRDSDFR